MCDINRGPRVLLIIPAFNEEENIEKVINNIIENYPQYDYVIINDCSWDNTENICIRNGYNYISLPIQMGIGGAVQTGYKYALENGYDIAFQVDGDGQHDPQYVHQMINEIEEGRADIVIGSRFVNKEGFQSSASRRTGINILSFFIWVCTGKRVKDVTSGYRAVNRKFIELFAYDYPDDYPEPEAIVMGVMHGGIIKEYPVVMRERASGISSINFRKSVYYMVKVSIAIFMRRLFDR